MALKQPSLLLYGYEVTIQNQALDFCNDISQTPSTCFQGTLTLGFYSLTCLMTEIAIVLNTLDPSNVYTVTANRNIAGGLENRITITSTGGFFSILFGTSMRAATSCADLVGFNHSDYTGATAYTGSFTTGSALLTQFPAYNFLPPENMKKIFGAVNVSAIGDKEAIVFQLQKFWQADFRYEPASSIQSEWESFFDWAVQQRLLEFTPEYNVPDTFYEGTLEQTAADSQGLGYTMTEMLPNFPNFYQTGLLKFRQTVPPSAFIL